MGIFDLQKALKDSIQTEKDAMDFYRYGAEKMAEDKARQTFELLAREELQHAKMFYKVYKGGDLPPFDDFIKLPPDTESSWWKALQQAMLADFDERKALELAIEQEDALEQELRATAAKIEDPEVKAIYLANASSTHHHFELIEEEYKAMLGMAG
ncbi:ferritin family protein [Desulfuromonas carbonis]|uniref:ferritin-like domain-containing protein n=1 Tax=Desulfuromonas sp. DDH964 TaxID=1823759 RepID=UPI00078DFDB1|nr:ferritin family protein [Desulfuromonas sp. DDH964]AMV73666.1 ferritin-like domain-containing protein [Desulfuromonas sp. DDH964]